MAIREIITANCENGQLSKSKIARQWDDQGTLIQFAGYPEPETDEELIFRLIVWMRASEDAEPDELPPIELEADQWLISNYYTQLPQMLRFQLCITNSDETYEKHSPIFSGIVDKSLSHDGEEAEIDVIPLFDPYKKYVDELVVDAGARVVDTELDETSTHLVENKAVAKAVANVNGRLAQQAQDIGYKANKLYGGSVTTTPVELTAGKAWGPTYGRHYDNATYAASVPITVTPDIESISTASGYKFLVYANNEGVGSHFDDVSPGWKTSVNPQAYPYTFVYINICRNDLGDITSDDLSNALILSKYTQVLPFATEATVSEDFGNLSSALCYKADNKYGGEEQSEYLTATNKSRWAPNGQRYTSGLDSRTSLDPIVITPDMLAIFCDSGYSMAVYANNNGVGYPLTLLGSSAWHTSFSLEGVDYKYLMVNIKKDDESDFEDGTTTVAYITRGTEILPYALESKVNDNFGNLSKRIGLATGTINSNGTLQYVVSRLVSTEYINLQKYSGLITVPSRKSILIAYYDSNFNWVKNSEWMNSSVQISDTEQYPYVRIVVRDLDHLSDDISGQAGTIDIIISKSVDSNSDLTLKTSGTGLITSPKETGGLLQIARLGWKVYASNTPPEQSLASYMLAYDNGCRILLADVQVTSDGKFVCRHDLDLGAQLSTNTVRHFDGSALTAEEKAQTVASLTLAELDQYDFGVYKGTKYTHLKILRLFEFLQFCKMMNCTAMLETKAALTASQVNEIATMIKMYGLQNHIIWSENAYASWAGISLPIITGQFPKAIIELRGGDNNYANCLSFAQNAMQTADNQFEIQFMTAGNITDAIVEELLTNGIGVSFSELKTEAALTSMISSGLIYKLKSVACSYINLGEHFRNLYSGGDTSAPQAIA